MALGRCAAPPLGKAPRMAHARVAAPCAARCSHVRPLQLRSPAAAGTAAAATAGAASIGVAAAAAGPPQPHGPSRPESGVVSVAPEAGTEHMQQVVAEIASARTYFELKALLERRPQDMSGNAAAYALLQAANLRGSADLEAMAELRVEQASSLMEAQDFVISTLTPAVELHISEYPLSTQVTLVCALAQLQTDCESVFSAVAAACVAAGDATGGMEQAVAAAAAAQERPEVTVIEPGAPPPSGGEETRGGAAGSADPYGVMGLQLMMVSSGFALAGHYDAEVFSLLARQTTRYIRSIAHMPTLINILGAFMDVQHFDRPLLEAAGMRLAECMDDLGPDDAAGVALVYAFFNVQNDAFYAALLARAAALNPESSDPKALSTLYRAVRLLPKQVAVPQKVHDLLARALELHGPLALSTLSPAVPTTKALFELEDNAGVTNEELVEMSSTYSVDSWSDQPAKQSSSRAFK
ncbi:hypothetical protein FOA52_016113 [Chlamydomonas sp. UWO 241]|nr:hypothetical protein FOA52_016113 [Chlamydomonas sp. UWO 241]